MSNKKKYDFEDLIIEKIDVENYNFSGLEENPFEEELVAYAACVTGAAYCSGGTIP